MAYLSEIFYTHHALIDRVSPLLRPDDRGIDSLALSILMKHKCLDKTLLSTVKV